jgi:hypothetical protein
VVILSLIANRGQSVLISLTSRSPVLQGQQHQGFRVAGVCYDQNTATLERLHETKDENFKNYMTSKTQGWFWCWGCVFTSDAAASPATGADPPAPDAAGGVGGGAAATTRARETAPELSDDKGTASLITQDREGGTTDNNRGASPI